MSSSGTFKIPQGLSLLWFAIWKFLLLAKSENNSSCELKSQVMLEEKGGGSMIGNESQIEIKKFRACVGELIKSKTASTP